MEEDEGFQVVVLLLKGGLMRLGGHVAGSEARTSCVDGHWPIGSLVGGECMNVWDDVSVPEDG